MKKSCLLLASACFLLTACDQYRGHTSSSAGNRSTTERADNTGRNVRDRSGETLTPGDQLENEADRTVTQKIRQAVVGDDSLSTNAKNVKIITINGVVTLRGVVNSEREKNVVSQMARSVSGVRNVDNQLEIVKSEGGATPGQTDQRSDRVETSRGSDLNR